MTQQSLQEQLKEYLLSLNLKPNDKIEGEMFLCEKFGVSRYYMREALNTLVQANILERKPKKGTIFKGFDVNQLSDQIRFQFEVSQFNVAEFKEARILIERAILPLSIQRITPAQMAELEAIIDKMIEHKNQPEIADQFDLQFHLLLFKSCGNEVLSAFSGVLTTLFKHAGYRQAYWSPEKIEHFAQEHRDILQAIKQGNIKLALEKLDLHLGYKNLEN